MGFYDTEENVNKYIEMAKGFDGRELIDILRKHVPAGSSVFELGTGPGVDLGILAKLYDVTGSDNSKVFVNRLQKLQPDYNIIELDIKNIQCDSQYDCVYSNKVLHHLTDEELKESLLQQRNILRSNGLLFHTFWQGEREEEMEGLLFNYHTTDSLIKIISNTFEVVDIEAYTEMENNDSLYVVLRRAIDR